MFHSGIRVLLLVFFLWIGKVHGQQLGIGISGIYNFQTESTGFGLRVPFFGSGKFNFVPQLAYYPGFNKVHELLAGMGVEYNFMVRRNTRIYSLGHAAFNGWLNYASSPKNGARFANWGAEVGIGLAGRGCINPFSEVRYNIKWRETNIRVGIAYIFGCKGGFTCPSYL